MLERSVHGNKIQMHNILTHWGMAYSSLRVGTAKLRSEAEATISIDDGMDAFIKSV